MQKNDWAIDSLRDVLLEYVKEKRSERRRKLLWRVIKFAVFVLLAYWIYCSAKSSKDVNFDMPGSSSSHLAKIKIEGVISDDSATANAEDVTNSLTKAFKNKNSVGILLEMNSPGGSAVQSNMIFESIMMLKKQYPNKPVYAVVSDMCASGCYYIASAADKILTDPVSIVGSIGVIFSNFGFVEAINKLGVERRVMTAGDHKDIMDPFKPILPWDKETMQNLLDNVHKKFIASVKLGRGTRLIKGKDSELFSGQFWIGEQAKDLGLIDGFGGRQDVMNILNAKKVVDYTVESDFFHRVGQKFGMQALLNGNSTPQLLRAW